VPIEPWWETNPATTPRQELGMVSPNSRNGNPFSPNGDGKTIRPRGRD